MPPEEQTEIPGYCETADALLNTVRYLDAHPEELHLLPRPEKIIPIEDLAKAMGLQIHVGGEIHEPEVSNEAAIYEETGKIVPRRFAKTLKITDISILEQAIAELSREDEGNLDEMLTMLLDFGIDITTSQRERTSQFHQLNEISETLSVAGFKWISLLMSFYTKSIPHLELNENEAFKEFFNSLYVTLDQTENLSACMPEENITDELITEISELEDELTLAQHTLLHDFDNNPESKLLAIYIETLKTKLWESTVNRSIILGITHVRDICHQRLSELSVADEKEEELTLAEREKQTKKLGFEIMKNLNDFNKSRNTDPSNSKINTRLLVTSLDQAGLRPHIYCDQESESLMLSMEIENIDTFTKFMNDLDRIAFHDHDITFKSLKRDLCSYCLEYVFDNGQNKQKTENKRRQAEQMLKFMVFFDLDKSTMPFLITILLETPANTGKATKIYEQLAIAHVNSKRMLATPLRNLRIERIRSSIYPLLNAIEATSAIDTETGTLLRNNLLRKTKNRVSTCKKLVEDKIKKYPDTNNKESENLVTALQNLINGLFDATDLLN